MDNVPVKHSSGSQPDSPDNTSDHRSRHESGHLSCSFPQTVKEAVAIAAGKKGASSKDEDRRKTLRSNMLCYLYWLLVLLILGLISFTVWLSIQLARRHSDAMNSQNGRFGEREPFTFDDLFNPTFKPKSFHVQWIKGRNGYAYRDKDGSLYYFNIEENKHEKLMDRTFFEDLKTDSFSVSPDLRYVLLKHDIKKKWRHSFTAKYSIYERHGRTGGSGLLEFPNDRELETRLSGKDLQYATWAPTTSSLVFAFGNNIYYQTDPRSEAKQLTINGDDKFIFNGVSDWLYEEEILGSHVAHWWSPDSRYICYASFNVTSVAKFRFPDYSSKNSLSGKFIEFAYPKAGDLDPGANTEVKVYVIDTKNTDGERKAIIAPPEIISKDHYAVQVAWRDSSHVMVVWSNRAQNKTVTTIYNVVTGTNFNNLYQIVVDGWFDPQPHVTFIQSESAYLTIMAPPKEDGDSWNQVAMVSAQDDAEGSVTFLTKGLEEVQEIVGYNSEKQLVFYLSTNGDSKHRHLLRVGTPMTDESLRKPYCMTCKLSEKCKYVEASFSSSGKYFVLGCLGPGVPNYRLMDINGTMSRLLEDNFELEKALANKILPDREYLDVPLGVGRSGVAEVLFLPGANSDEKSKKYPVLVFAQNGPGTQLVTERFRLGWETYLTSSEEVVVAYIDGRGASSRGNKFKHQIYRKLGVAEAQDEQLGGVFLKENLDYVDGAKMAIWGWSYGGFVTSHAVANDTDAYPCGISVAANSNGKSFASAYFERYMGLPSPDDNEEGYEKTDFAKKIEYLRNKKFLMIHGTADDNAIPYASSIPLMRMLTDDNIQYRFQLYTDLQDPYSIELNHRHLYRLMTDFLKNECFSYFWRHETKSWIVDKSQKKDKFRIKQFCV